MKEPTLEEVLEEVFESKLATVYTALPGAVVKYYPEKQTADIQIQVKDHDFQEDGRPVFKSFPILANVPIAFPRGGSFFMTFPLAAGDNVLLVFCKSSIDQWRAKGVETSPGDLRQHSLTGAVAYPGLYPKTKALDASDENLVIGHESETSVAHFKPNGEVHVGAEDASDAAALASKVDAFITLIDTVLSSWTVVPADGGAALQAYYAAQKLLAYPPGGLIPSVESEILKVDE